MAQEPTVTPELLTKFISECNDLPGNIVIDHAYVQIYKSFGSLADKRPRQRVPNNFLIIFVGNSDYTLHTNFKIHAYSVDLKKKFPGNLHDEIVYGKSFQIKEASKTNSVIFESDYSAVPMTDNSTGTQNTNFMETAKYLHVTEYRFRDSASFKRFSSLLKMEPQDLIINLRQQKIETLDFKQQGGSGKVRPNYEKLIKKRCKTLRVLNIERNKLKEFPRSFHKTRYSFDKLEELNISNNGFSFLHNQFVRNMNKELKSLDLSCNAFNSFEDLEIESNMPRTTSTVSSTFQKSTRFVSAIKDLEKLEYLNLYGNEIESPPSWFCDFKNLKELNLSKQHGVLRNLDNFPIEKLENLEVLDIRENDLSSLPVGIGQMKSLKILDASDNYSAFKNLCRAPKFGNFWAFLE